MSNNKILFRALAMTGVLASTMPSIAAAAGPNPILFVTQVPTAGFQNVAASFGAHQPTIQQTPRGGDLWIRYPDGSMRNLTKEAGYGLDAAQEGDNAIAVRQPSMSFNGTKAIFAMVTGAPTRQFQVQTYKWQLYEVSGLAKGDTAQITKVACQPDGFNNIAPIYASDGQIIFVSDRPRNGASNLYPQRDEYESSAIETGLWKIDRKTCSFRILEHAPSGVTYPSIDSAGRVIFTKWDHLQRDQQADADIFDGGGYGTFNYDSEEASAPPAVHSRQEKFPELRQAQYSLLPGQGFDDHAIASDYPFSSHIFNQFMPWMLNQDGSGEETLNHVGRHEIGGTYTDGSYRNDDALHYAIQGALTGGTFFLRGDGGMFHIKEDPLHAGRFFGTRGPEFGTATAGDIIRLDGGVGMNPEQMLVVPVALKGGAMGSLRNPLPTSDGQLIVSQTASTDQLTNTGSSANPVFNYSFRLRTLDVSGEQPALGAFLTGAGLSKSLQWWDPDQRVTWSGTLWELDPVEVRARAVPKRTLQSPVPKPEKRAFDRLGVEPVLLRNWLHQRGLALVVSRDVTRRDRADQQQPFNLTVKGTAKSTIGKPGATVYDISHMQFFQADQIRGYSTDGTPQEGGHVQPGRRVLAQPMHDTAALSAMGAFAAPKIKGATKIGNDGSMAAFVPAGRAMTWELIDSSKAGWDRAIVRERNWLSFKPGELRVCASCHGVNVEDQVGRPEAQNTPQALTKLLTSWKKVVRNQCAATGGTGAWSYTGVAFSAWEDGRRYRIQTCQGGNGCCDGMPKTEVDTQ